MASGSIYRSAAGRDLVRRWCGEQLDGWDVPHERTVVGAAGAQTHVVSGGTVGLTGLRLPPGLLAASAARFLRPAPRSSARFLRAMLAPGHEPGERLVEWMTLAARHSRSGGAPGRAAMPAKPVTRTVFTGEHDVFLPPKRLGAAVTRTLGVELRVLPGAGQLVVEEAPDRPAAPVDGGTR
ncbi:alpha/beta fold hydrolase [Streptomyces nojiriensis]|uniref:alpha/beta fold hydrolase n=1 Tax=Streptomyces nojiriensis TaxID=66374 RepID=UPI0035E11296